MTGENDRHDTAAASRDSAARAAEAPAPLEPAPIATEPAAAPPNSVAAKGLRYRITAAIERAASATRASAAHAGKRLSASWAGKLTARLAALIAAKGVRYWLFAIAMLIAAYAASQWLYEVQKLSVWRAYYFQWLIDHGPRIAYAKYVRLVLIGDKEYTSIGIAGKAPNEEVYLTQLVAALATPANHANVIAIDFVFAGPAAPAPQGDDCALVDAIHTAVQRGSRVVLPSVILQDPATKAFHREPDIYQAFGLCPADRPVEPATCRDPYHTDFTPIERARIACGFIALPPDFARVPTLLPKGDGTTLDSFALAIARAAEPKITENLLGAFHEHFPIGHFMRIDAFSRAGHEFPAGDIPGDQINGAIAIIGASWHTVAENQGPLIDVHDTPAEKMVGAMLHANYVEALLDQRTASALSEAATRWLEIGFGIVAALVFAAAPGWRGLGALAPLIVAMLVVQWIVLHTFDIYFDVLVLLLGLALHSFLENLVGSHGHAPEPEAS